MTSRIELTFSLRAEANIRNILQYTLQTWGRGQKDAYQQRLEQAFLTIRDFPDIGYPVAAGSRIRAYHLEHHTIVYRRDPDAVTILRVVNPRRLRR
jgi:toxin ParE1/3/4